jgi:MFS family permease
MRNWSHAWRFNPDALRLIGSWGLMAFGYFGIQGVLLNLYLLRLGFSVETIGLLIATGQFIWGLMALPASFAGQRFGLRSAIMAGFFMTMLGMGLILWVEWIPPAWQLTWVFGGWIILWFGSAFNSVNGAPYMMLATGAAERRHAFAAQSAIIAFAGLVGGLIAGVLPGLVAGWLGASLDDPAPYRLVLWIAPTVYLLAGLVIRGVRPLRAPVVDLSERGSAPPWILFLYLGLVIFLQTSGEGSARAFFNVYLDAGLALQTAQIGAIMGIAQALPVAAALGSPAIMHRFGPARTMVISSLGVGAAFIVMATVVHWAVAGLSFAIIVAMIAVNGTARNVFTQELVSGHWRTTASAVQTIGMSLGWATMAAVGGFLIQATGFRGLFFASAGLAVAGALLLLLGDWVQLRAASQTVK